MRTTPPNSFSTIENLAWPAPLTYVVRHSTTNCRFGGVPVTAVKMPEPLEFVSRSSQSAIAARPRMRDGRHAFAHQRFSFVKLSIPLELTLAVVYCCP